MATPSVHVSLQNTSLNHNVTKVSNQCFENNPISIKILSAVAYSILIIGSLIGNSLVIAVVRRDRTTKKTIIYFIQNIAVADILITIVYMPRMIAAVLRGYQWLVDGNLGSTLCKLVPLCHHAAILVSIQTLVIISVERFLAILYPLRRNITTKQAKYLIAMAWLTSVAVRIPRSLTLKLLPSKDLDGKLYCRPAFSSVYSSNAKQVRRIYYELLLYLFYVLPMILITFLNFFVVLTLKRKKAPGNRVVSENKRRHILNRKVFRMLFTVTALFIFCWLMYFIILAIPNRKYTCQVGFIRLFLAHANSVLTPFVYFLFNAAYRQRVRRIFCLISKVDTNKKSLQLKFDSRTAKL